MDINSGMPGPGAAPLWVAEGEAGTALAGPEAHTSPLQVSSAGSRTGKTRTFICCLPSFPSSTSPILDSTMEQHSQGDPQNEVLWDQLEPPEPAEAEPGGKEALV